MLIDVHGHYKISAIHSMSSHYVPCRHEIRRDDMERDDMDNIAHAHR